jgi:hypothetical protein
MNLRGYVIVVNAHPAVVDLLKNEERIAVKRPSDVPRRIELVPRKEYHLEQFDLLGQVGHMSDRPRPTPLRRPSRRRATPTARREGRVTINKEFESYDAFISEYVTNISRKGVFVRSKNPLPIGTKVNLRFTVIMDDIETIEGVGEVVRVHDDPPGMGVVFTELSTTRRPSWTGSLIRRRRAEPRSAHVFRRRNEMFTGLVEALGHLRQRAAGPWCARASRRAMHPLDLGESIAVTACVSRSTASCRAASRRTCPRRRWQDDARRARCWDPNVHLERATPLGGRMGGTWCSGTWTASGTVSAVTPVGETRRLSVRRRPRSGRLPRGKGLDCDRRREPHRQPGPRRRGHPSLRRDARPAHARAHEAAGSLAWGRREP